MHSLQWFLYYLEKPFHSPRHKKIKRLASQYAKDNDSYNKVLLEIAEYTGESPDLIKSRYEKLLGEVSSKDYDSLSEKQLDSFYSTTNHYLYELPLWNAGSGRTWALLNHIVPYFKKKKYYQILDFGGGTGDLSLGLAKEGFSVSYTDLNKPAIAFAKWRADRYKTTLKFLNSDQLEKIGFDCIVSFDVFEHLKNLPEKVNYLASLLGLKGALIFNIEFSGEGLHLEENKKYQSIRLFDSILVEAGLSFDKKFKDIFFYIKR